MRAILDTNVLISAFFWHGPPHQLLERIGKGAITLVSSQALLTELGEVIGREKFDAILIRSYTSRERSLEEVRRLVEIIDPPLLSERVCRDPDDDQILALAIAAQADFIVSGDRDLLVLRAFQGIPILTAAEALDFITQR